MCIVSFFRIVNTVRSFGTSAIRVDAQITPLRKGILPIPRSEPVNENKRNTKRPSRSLDNTQLGSSGLDALHQTLPQRVAHIVEAADDVLTLALAPFVLDFAFPGTS